MLQTFIRRIDRLRFEAPLALALAAAAAFAVVAMPPALLGRVPGVTAPTGRLIAAALAFALSGVVAYTAMKLAGASTPATTRAPAAVRHDPVIVVPPPVDEAEGAEVRTRRADRHPDAPPRAPIIASRDLGQPFMDVAPAAAAAPSRFLVGETAVATPVAPEPPETAPVADPVAADVAVLVPAGDGAPRVARTPRADIGSLVDRLSAGVERRGGLPPVRRAAVGGAPARRRVAAGDLRRALDELNRLAARHA